MTPQGRYGLPRALREASRPRSKSPVSQVLHDMQAEARAALAKEKAEAEKARLAALSADLPPFPKTPQPGGPEGHVVISFYAPRATAQKGTNQRNKKDFRPDHTNKKAWEQRAEEATVAMKAQLAPYRGHRILVTYALPGSDQRDVDNWLGGPSVKGIQDGIAKTGLLVPRDNFTWLDARCSFWKGNGDLEIRVKVEVAPPREDPADWVLPLDEPA